jgi:hypothetical protein
MPFDGELSRKLDSHGWIDERFSVSYFVGNKYGGAPYIESKKQSRASRVFRGNWDEFVDELRRRYSTRPFKSKSYAPLYAPTEFEFNWRKRRNVTSIGIVPLDVDYNAPGFWEVTDRLKEEGLDHVIYTTASNRTLGAGCRIRLVFPLSEPVDHWGYAACRQEIVELLGRLFPGIIIDEKTKAPNACFYVPGRYAGAVNVFHSVRGRPWDVDAGWSLKAKAIEREEQPQPPRCRELSDRVLAALQTIRCAFRVGFGQQMKWKDVPAIGEAAYVCINDRCFVHSLAVVIDDASDAGVAAALDGLRSVGAPLPNWRVRNYLIWWLGGSQKAIQLKTEAQKKRFEGWLNAILSGLARTTKGRACDLFEPVANPLLGDVIHEEPYRLADFKGAQPRGGRSSGLAAPRDNPERSRHKRGFDRIRETAYRNARPGWTSKQYDDLLLPYVSEIREEAIAAYGVKDHDYAIEEVEATIRAVSEWMATQFQHGKECANRGVMGLAGSDLDQREKQSLSAKRTNGMRGAKSLRPRILAHLKKFPHLGRADVVAAFNGVSKRTVDYVIAAFRRISRPPYPPALYYHRVATPHSVATTVGDKLSLNGREGRPGWVLALADRLKATLPETRAGPNSS